MNSTEKMMLDYSIVIPSYNEEENIKPLIERIETVMNGVGGTYEIVMVDNGSYDSTPLVLGNLLHKHNSLVVVTLTRNFGYDGGIAAGLKYARGRWILIMDADQQDPPEVIPQFINKAKEGYDIVYGIRAKRTEKWYIRLPMKAFYRIWKVIVRFDIPKDAGNFSIISREVVDIINCLSEHNKFIRGLRAWTGYPSAGLVYQRQKRSCGKTKFSFLGYMNHALNGITSFSVLPLRMLTYAGIFGLLLCILLGVFFSVVRISAFLGYEFVRYERGWTSVALLILTAISINLLGFGIIGEYIGRIFKEIKNRPDFLIRKVTYSSNQQHQQYVITYDKNK